MKNMNRLTRIYGLKCRHHLHELTGGIIAVDQLQVRAETPNC